MRELGASGVSFDIISAAGERSAMPHATPSDRVISAGDALTLILVACMITMSAI